MNAMDRSRNSETYLDDIGTAIKHMVERCGGSLESAEGQLPRELVIWQRTLFVHSGIAGVMATAIMDRDVKTMELFDWLLGYYISLDKADGVDQNRFIVSMLTAIYEQVYHHYSDQEDPRFARFADLFRVAIMTLDGHIDSEEHSAIDEFCRPLAERHFLRKARERQENAEKN